MNKLKFNPVGGGEGLDFSPFAPGFDSEIARRWGKHVIPGQRGQLMEDIGDGSLATPIQLTFTRIEDYNKIMDALAKSPRGQLVQPLRGARRSVLTRAKESVRWTQRGDVIIVDLTFEDAALSEPDQFKGGPAAQAQQVRAQSAAATAAGAVQFARITSQKVNAANLRLRAKIRDAIALVAAVTATAKDYTTKAILAWQSGIFDPAPSHQLRSLPALVEAACIALRATGPAHEVQAAIIALEMMLAGANGLDAAIRASQPIPIETIISRPAGQSIYAFVQQHYARKGKTPSQMREIARTILGWNRNIRTPSLIPFGSAVVRPAA